MSKVKIVQEKSSTIVFLANKESQKLYLPVKNKTNLRTNWKTKLKQGA